MIIIKKKHNNHLILLYFLFIFFPNFSYGQIPPKDQKIIDQCKSLEDDEPGKAIEFARKSIFEIDNKSQIILNAQLMGCLGWALAMNNQQEFSRIKAEEIEKLTNSLSESPDKLSLYMRAGGIFHLLGDRISAASNYNKAFMVAENLKLKKN